VSDILFNITRGQKSELHLRVNANDPTNAVLVIVAVVSTDTQAVLEDVDDLTELLALSNTAEATNSGYSRLILTDTDLEDIRVNHTTNTMELDLTNDPVFSSVSDGDNWTHLVFCYDSDSTSGSDSNIIPMTMHDFVVTPNGGDITVGIDPVGYCRS